MEKLYSNARTKTLLKSILVVIIPFIFFTILILNEVLCGKASVNDSSVRKDIYLIIEGYVRYGIILQSFLCQIFYYKWLKKAYTFYVSRKKIRRNMVLVIIVNAGVVGLFTIFLLGLDKIIINELLFSLEVFILLCAVGLLGSILCYIAEIGVVQLVLLVLAIVIPFSVKKLIVYPLRSHFLIIGVMTVVLALSFILFSKKAFEIDFNIGESGSDE